LQQIFIEINMERYTDRKRVMNLIFDSFKKRIDSDLVALRFQGFDGCYIDFKYNNIGFSSIGFSFSVYSFLDLKAVSSHLHFSELENYIYPFMKEYGLTTQKLVEMISMIIPLEFVKFNFNQMIEPNYYGKFKFYSDADIEPFVDFLVQYYQEQHLPFVQAFDTLEKYYNYVEEKTKDRPKEWTRGWFYTERENFIRPLLYHYFDKSQLVKYINNIEVGKSISQGYFDKLRAFYDLLNSGNLFSKKNEKINRLNKNEQYNDVFKNKKNYSLTINLEDDIGEGNNCYVRLIEDLAALFGEYFTPTEITENWGHEEHFLVFSFRNKHAVYEFHPKDNGQYLDEEIIQKVYRIAQSNNLPQKLYAEVNEDTMSLELKFHVCLPSEKEALEQRLNVNLNEYLF
jgi:hypothetical protein